MAGTHKTIVVTGASTGIGRAVVEGLADRGFSVWATVRREPEQPLPEGVRTVVMDVRHIDEVVEAFRVVLEQGPVDVLINNAGVGDTSTVEDMDLGVLNDVYQTNVTGVVACTQQVLPSMRERGSGHVVNISSITGRVPILAQGAHVASKHALEGLSECLAMEVRPFGIHVTLIEPGVVLSEIFRKNARFPKETAYGWAYERVTEFYMSGIAAAVPPSVVADAVGAAIDAPGRCVRYTCGWAGDLIEQRGRITDEEWIALPGLGGDGFRSALSELGLELFDPGG